MTAAAGGALLVVVSPILVAGASTVVRVPYCAPSIRSLRSLASGLFDSRCPVLER
jgi:hypothetical protein